jgi:hypothetical protein
MAFLPNFLPTLVSPIHASSNFLLREFRKKDRGAHFLQERPVPRKPTILSVKSLAI